MNINIVKPEPVPPPDVISIELSDAEWESIQYVLWATREGHRIGSVPVSEDMQRVAGQIWDGVYSAKAKERKNA